MAFAVAKIQKKNENKNFFNKIYHLFLRPKFIITIKIIISQ